MHGLVYASRVPAVVFTLYVPHLCCVVDAVFCHILLVYPLSFVDQLVRSQKIEPQLHHADLQDDSVHFSLVQYSSEIDNASVYCHASHSLDKSLRLSAQNAVYSILRL